MTEMVYVYVNNWIFVPLDRACVSFCTSEKYKVSVISGGWGQKGGGGNYLEHNMYWIWEVQNDDLLPYMHWFLQMFWLWNWPAEMNNNIYNFIV